MPAPDNPKLREELTQVAASLDSLVKASTVQAAIRRR
jgi:hypothetical protein